MDEDTPTDMKFTRDQYNLKPPSVHGWMRKHYCPVLADLLSFETIKPLVEKSWARDTYNLQLISPDYGMLLETRNAHSAGARKAFDAWNGEGENGIRIRLYFTIGKSLSSPDHSTDFNIDDAYLVPYLFTAVKSGILFRNIALIEDRLTRMERIGLIDPGFKDRTRITLVHASY